MATRFDATLTDLERWRTLLREESLPCLVVDLDALEANRETMLAAMGPSNVTLRLATKSLRCPGLLRILLDEGAPRIQGVMAYSAGEADLLARLGFDDIVMGYPSPTPRDAGILSALVGRGVNVRAMVDCLEHLSLLQAAASAAQQVLPVCIDMDVSWRPLGMHVGVRRSPLRTAESVAALADAIVQLPNLKLVGLMAYEAAVAGVQDRTPGAPAQGPPVRLVKNRSRALASRARAQALQALYLAGHELELVNGGGSGSIHSTAMDPSITEVSAGSGFLCPHLFDGYSNLDLTPAMFFVIPVARFPSDGHVTCAGGGHLASGPADAHRAPQVVCPPGLEVTSAEGWGEVQTPFMTSRKTPPLVLGDPVVCRHGKGGEICEHFEEVLFVRGTDVVERAPTMRSLGGCFG